MASGGPARFGSSRGAPGAPCGGRCRQASTGAGRATTSGLRTPRARRSPGRGIGRRARPPAGKRCRSSGTAGLPACRRERPRTGCRLPRSRARRAARGRPGPHTTTRPHDTAELLELPDVAGRPPAGNAPAGRRSTRRRGGWRPPGRVPRAAGRAPAESGGAPRARCPRRRRTNSTSARCARHTPRSNLPGAPGDWSAAWPRTPPEPGELT